MSKRTKRMKLLSVSKVANSTVVARKFETVLPLMVSFVALLLSSMCMISC